MPVQQVPVPVSVGAKLSFVEPGHTWAHSPSPSIAPGISYQGNMVSNYYIVFLLFLLSTLHLALDILRCPTRWQLPPVATSVLVHDSPLWAPRAPGPTSACGAAFAFSCFFWRFRRAPEGFFFLWTMTGSPVRCKELSSCGRVPTRGPSFECSLFYSSPSSVIRWGHGGWGVPGLAASYDIRLGDGVGLF